MLESSLQHLSPTGIREQGFSLWRQLNLTIEFPAMLEVDEGMLACFVSGKKILKVLPSGLYRIDETSFPVLYNVVKQNDYGDKLLLYYFIADNEMTIRLFLEPLECFADDVELRCKVLDPLALWTPYIQKSMTNLTFSDINSGLKSELQEVFFSVACDVARENPHAAMQDLEKAFLHAPALKKIGCEIVSFTAIEQIKEYSDNVDWSRHADATAIQFCSYHSPHSSGHPFLTLLTNNDVEIFTPGGGGVVQETEISGCVDLSYDDRPSIPRPEYIKCSNIGIHILSSYIDKLELTVSHLIPFGKSRSKRFSLVPNEVIFLESSGGIPGARLLLGFWTSQGSFDDYMSELKRQQEEDIKMIEREHNMKLNF